MQPFNQALVGLYDLAEHVSHNDFLADALKLLQPWIDFDGAILVMGAIDNAIVTNLLTTHTHNQVQTLIEADIQQSALDPMIKVFADHLDKPIQWDRSALHHQHNVHGFNNYVLRHKQQHFMLFGENPTATKLGRWIVLCREKNVPFNALEINYFHTAWFHLIQSLDINRSRILDRHDPDRMRRAAALIDAHGFITVADNHFHQLLLQEWPEYQVFKMPVLIMNSFLQGRNVYRGRQVEIVMTQQPGYITCLASAINIQTELTPSEYMVARRYAKGLNHKSIARELGVSPHTVRNQIAHLYDKLGVHDKTALAQSLAMGVSYRPNGGVNGK